MLLSILTVLTALTVTAVLLILQVKLSGREKAWPGLIPIVLMLVFTLGVNGAVYLQYGKTDLEILTAGLDNGMTARMYVRTAGDEIRAYSPLEIIDSEGILRDSILLQSTQDEEYTEPYFGLFQKMTAGKIITANYATDKEIVTDRTKSIVNLNIGYATYSTFWQLFAPLLYMGLPLMAIHFIKRRQVKREKISAEMRKIAIENL